MLSYPNFDPVLVSVYLPRLGEIQLRWYSLMYALGLGALYLFFKRSIRRETLEITSDQAESVLIAALLGMIVGARLLYVWFYNFTYYAANPTEIIQVWRGGLAFHGGLIGAWVAIWAYARRRSLGFLNLTDHFSLILPLGLAFGRIGNFVNGELWGTVTEMPWGMVFPGAGPLPRHPSQIYEALIEGPFLMIFLWVLWRTRPDKGIVTSWFLIVYGVGRFFCEFFREPDMQLGPVLGPLTMGQLLSGVMTLAGTALGGKIYSSGSTRV